MALTTTHGDVIPDEVGSIGFHVNVIIEIPKLICTEFAGNVCGKYGSF